MISIVTGSGGLIGSEAVRFLIGKEVQVIGIDNDMRSRFFGADASTQWNVRSLQESSGQYVHKSIDIRDVDAIDAVFGEYGTDIGLVVHAAAQPSHDWAAQDPFTDFSINATGTHVLLEAMRRHAPKAVFVFLSTNKVYGDRPNSLPLAELETRWEIDPSHPFAAGIDERMPIDQSMHSLFGVSKTAADLLVQEYGRYFGMPTVCFRGGCLTGPSHSGASLHGFLSYMARCAVRGEPYVVIGHKGKQVRDNIHSEDLVNAIWHFYQAPRAGEVYNIGGGRFSNCSVLEAIDLCEQATGRKFDWSYQDEPRQGDHIWWISDTRKFEAHYPGWRRGYDVRRIIEDICRSNRARWTDDDAA